MTIAMCRYCGTLIPKDRNTCPECERKAELNQHAVRFIKVQLKRSRNNLKAAQDRGDTKAVTNIERKIEIFEYLSEVLTKERNNKCGM